MSVSVSVYIGPYVEFRSPPGSDARRVERPDNDALSILNGMCDAREVRHGIEWTVYRFVPNQMRTGEAHPRPDRDLLLDPGVRDCTVPLADVDREAEQTWLETLYAEEIQAMQEQSGLTPVFGWGLVRGCS